MRNLYAFLLLCSTVGSSQPAAQAADGQSTASKLPKVVLIGDSIRLSYSPTVSEVLKNKALVVSPKPNGGDSNNVLRLLKEWVIDEQPTVVHLNCGIHDTKKFKSTGKFQVSPEQYAENLRKIVARIIDETDAVVLFATSTPILDDRAASVRAGRDYELLNASIEQYNAIAVRVMKELKVPVNDLNELLLNPKPPLKTEDLIVADGVHLTESARRLLGERVGAFVSQHLPVQSK